MCLKYAQKKVVRWPQAACVKLPKMVVFIPGGGGGRGAGGGYSLPISGELGYNPKNSLKGFESLFALYLFLFLLLCLFCIVFHCSTL